MTACCGDACRLFRAFLPQDQTKVDGFRNMIDGLPRTFEFWLGCGKLEIGWQAERTNRVNAPFHCWTSQQWHPAL